MKNSKFIIGLIAVACTIVAIYFVLRSELALIVTPKGIIAESILHVIRRNLLLMIIVVFPTLILLFLTLWRYRANNSKAKYDPERYSGIYVQVMLWIIPSIIIAVMIVKTWRDAHELDPYQPLKSDKKPLIIQVVAIDWKWLFIYPEQGIATVNFVQFPAKRPIQFQLAADNSPMNSFWIPQLSGQIYSMTGMVTPLHVMANVEGTYAGRAAEINGDGYADMTFIAEASSESKFERWVQSVKESPLHLSFVVYNELRERSTNPIALYSFVEEDLFKKIVMKYLHPHTKSLWKTLSTEN